MVMIKKRAMVKDKWGDGDWVINDAKRLETGYAEHQPKWPYWVEPQCYSEAAWLDMNVWMIDTFGSGNWGIPNVRWVGSDRKYWFRDAADRTFFILRWS
jgi:hypothetical protein